ncbi:transcription regulator HTH, apses-type DNA-binding domain-containing protein [Sporodiniella umbellata]|nr:transcription regulator HTH, apses-type DNA-binding domain-containing protein [Sporodiniella umbellata]
MCEWNEMSIKKRQMVFGSLFLPFIHCFSMFHYSSPVHGAPTNESQQKIAEPQSLSYSTHYHYDPEFYHDTPWPIEPNDDSTHLMRPRTSTSVWDDEGTVCYQVDVRGICVTRRQDNDMINGTKLLNVSGMSRGKRDGILKNEKGRVVVKVGAMHLKGVWVTFARAKALAIQYSIIDALYPLFVDEPACYFYPHSISHTTSSHQHHSPSRVYLQDCTSPYPPWDYPVYSDPAYLPLAPSVPSMLPSDFHPYYC